MYQFFKTKQKNTYFFLLTSVFAVALLLMVVFKNDEKLSSGGKSISFQNPSFITIKEFLLEKINSPFTNINYEIKSGDSIQKILKNLKIQNKEIQEIISKYKKYSNPNKLLVGNKIEIVVEENISGKVIQYLNLVFQLHAARLLKFPKMMKEKLKQIK